MRHNSPGQRPLGLRGLSERHLLDKTAMERFAARRLRTRGRSAQGFSVIELLIVVAILGVLASIAIGVTPAVIQSAKGQSGASQLNAFLKRNRELAISRRRNIEIAFTPPNQVQALQRAVPDPAVVPTPPPTPLETMFLEGRLEYRTFGAIPDTPDLFGNATPVVLGGADPVMFTSEGSFTDVNGDPVNASIFLGVLNQPSTANALTIIGTTATMRAWRYDGSRWVQ
jgi:prepilin-type N-terminal cleavage/methylation domain-containing protein